MRRAFLVLAIVAASAVALPPSLTPSGRAAPGQPNIVIFLSDDVPFGTLRREVMPNVYKRIVRRGTTFKRFYISNPICCPSRASILTGLYASHTKTYTNHPGTGGSGDPWHTYGGTSAFHDNGNETRTIAYRLDQEGYQTGLFGKYLNRYTAYAESRNGPEWKPQGWDHWNAFYGGNGKYWDYELNINGVLESHGTARRDYSTTVLGHDVANWIRNGVDTADPFFAFYAPFSAHGPASAHPRDSDRFLDYPPLVSKAIGENTRDKPTYIRRNKRSDGSRRDQQAFRIRQLQSLYSFDREVGRIMNAVKARGEFDNTIFLYLSDNGIGWAEHDWVYKLVPYERVVRVPATIRGPGIGVGTTDALVSNVDVKRTLLQLVGISAGSSDGINMLSESRTHLLLESMFYPRSRKGAVPSYCGLVTSDMWKYVVYAPPNRDPTLVRGGFEDELYNLARDPQELDNLSHFRKNLRKRAELRNTLRPLCELPDVQEQDPDWFDRW